MPPTPSRSSSRSVSTASGCGFTLPGVQPPAPRVASADQARSRRRGRRRTSAASRRGGRARPSRSDRRNLADAPRPAASGDGTRVAESRRRELEPARPVKAGQRDVIVTFLKKSSALDETLRLPFLRPYPAGVNIPETRLGARCAASRSAARTTAHAAGDSPSRRRIFMCRPTAAPRRAAPAGRPVLAKDRVRQDDPVDAGAPRVSTSGQRRRPRAAARALQRGPGAGRIRRRHRARA